MTINTLCLSLFWFIAALIVASGIPLASARPWAWPPLAAAIGLITPLWLYALQTSRHGSLHLPHLRPLLIPAVLLAAVIAWAIAQTLPHTPASWHHPLWQMLDSDTSQGSIAVNRSAALDSITRLLLYGVVFFVVAMMAASRRRASTLLKVLAGAALAYACYSLITYFVGNTRVVWLEKYAYMQDLTGTFINRNAFASFLGLGLLAMLTLLMRTIKQALRSSGMRQPSWQIVIRQLIEPATLHLLLGAILITTALLLTNSRAGVVATLLGAVFIFWQGIGWKALPRWLSFGGMLSALLLVMLLLSGSQTAVINRLAETSLDAEDRPKVYALTWQAIQNAPLLGYGLGNFNDIFPLYRSAEIAHYYDKAHNDHLELVFDLGLPAALLFYGSWLWLLVALARRHRVMRRGRLYVTLGLAATIMLSVHMLVDFPAQMPAIMLWYMAIMGLAYGQAFRQREPGER